MAQAAGLTTRTVFGGVGQNPQVAALRKGVDIVVACPGRLEDLIQQGHCTLADVQITVLDEADHMADLGFLPSVRRLLSKTPQGSQRLLFSATLDRAIDGLVRQFLINPFGLRYDEITASSLVKIAIDGEIVEAGSGEFGETINPAGWVIHRAIHQARDDAHCVMHTHTIAGSAVSALDCGLLPVTLESMGFTGKVGYHDYEGVTVEDEEGPRLVRDMGENNAMILRNHGLLVAGGTVGEVLGALISQYPSLRSQLLTEDGELNRFVNVYLNDQDIRYLQERATPVDAQDTLIILPAMAGGAR